MTKHREDKTLLQLAAKQCWKNIGVLGDGSCKELETAVHCHNCPVFSQAGQQLLEGEPPAEYIREQTALLAAELEDETAGSEALIVFRIGKEWLALDVDVLVEVAQPRIVQRVPHRSNQLLLGIVNIRGEIQLCVSLRSLLGMADADRLAGSGADPSPSTCRLLVCERDGVRWACAVDEVSGVQRIGVNQLGNVPSTVAKSVKRLTNAVFRWEEKSVGRLDQERLFDSLEGNIR